MVLKRKICGFCNGILAMISWSRIATTKTSRRHTALWERLVPSYEWMQNVGNHSLDDILDALERSPLITVCRVSMKTGTARTVGKILYDDGFHPYYLQSTPCQWYIILWLLDFKISPCFESKCLYSFGYFPGVWFNCSMPTFRNTLSVPSSKAGCEVWSMKYFIPHIQPLKMELIECSETSAYCNFNQTPRKYPKENIHLNSVTLSNHGYQFYLLYCLRISLYLHVMIRTKQRTVTVRCGKINMRYYRIVSNRSLRKSTE